MKKLTIFLFALLALSTATTAADKALLVTLEWRNGAASLEDPEVFYGEAPDYKIPPLNPMEFRLNDASGLPLDSFLVSDPRIVLYDYVDENGSFSGGMFFDKNARADVVLPFFQQAQELAVYDENHSLVAKTGLKKALNDFCEQNPSDEYCVGEGVEEDKTVLLAYAVAGLLAIGLLVYFARRKPRK